MNLFLKNFKELIQSIYGPNLAIGGVNALFAHGLKMSRQTKDLDVILFQPTANQLKVLENLKFFDLVHKDKPDDGYPQRVFKFTKNDLFLDVIISDDPMPDGCLLYKFGDVYYPVNSIENVIAAKNSYHLKRKKDSGLSLYVREKDLADFLDLKNSNFNYVSVNKSI